jgi:hypothetical protein
MAQPPWGQQQPPEYPPPGRPRRHEQSPSHGQQAYEQQQQPYGQPSYEQQQPYGQPSYGQSRQYPPYDQPRQYPPYGQPPYGNGGQQPPYGGAGGQYGGPGGQYGGPGGQYGGGPGGQYPPPYGPERRGNGFAIAGIILAILLWPLGLVFAIIGLVKSRARAGAGKVLSIVAIVVAAVVGAATISFVAIVGNSTAADPGCISAENAFQSMTNKISSDDSAMSADANNRAKEKADIKGFITDVQTLVTKLNAAEAEATHQSVRSTVGKASSDMSTMLSALQAVENGNTSQSSVLDNKASSMNGDGTAIDNICSSF